jgi:hypothetical protein
MQGCSCASSFTASPASGPAFRRSSWSWLATFAEALRQLAERLPTFGRECIAKGQLHSTLSANLGGERFVSDPAVVIRDGQSLLILSADAGG